MKRQAALAAAMGLFCAASGGASPASGQQQEVAQAVYAKVAPSVLLIVVEDAAGKPIAQGSGFVIGSNRVVTNAHVVRGGSAFVHTGVAKVPCAVTHIDESVDLAVLQPAVALTAPALRAAPENTPIGTRVFALGNPQGLERTITEGLYTGPRTIQGRTLLQISAPISAGSSGGPVVDSNGLVVGVAVASLETGQNLNFAVPVDTLIAVLARPAPGQAPAPPPPPPPAPAPKPVAAQPGQPSAAAAVNLQDFEAVQKKRLAMGLSNATERQWVDMRKRERDLLSAAANVSKTDDDFRAVFFAALNEHSDIALDMARIALKYRTAPQAWHYTGIATAAFAFSGIVQEPETTELLKEAKAAILEGLKLNAASWVWALAGQIHDELREWGAAKAAFNLAMTAGADARDRPRILRGQWRSAAALNEHADADRFWAEYVKTGAVSDQDYHDRANIIGLQQRMSEAAAIFAMLAQKSRQRTSATTYDLWYSATWAHWKAHEDKAALAAAAETVRATPDTPAARRVAAMAMTIAASIQAEIGDYKGALESANLAISADPTLPSSYTQLAKVHLAAKRFAEAEREARRTLSMVTGPESEAHYVLGQIFGAQSRWAEAAQSFTDAAVVDAANPYPAFNAAISFENAGRIPDAIRWYEEALRRNPTMKEHDQIRAILAKLKGGR